GRPGWGFELADTGKTTNIYRLMPMTPIKVNIPKTCQHYKVRPKNITDLTNFRSVIICQHFIDDIGYIKLASGKVISWIRLPRLKILRITSNRQSSKAIAQNNFLEAKINSCN